MESENEQDQDESNSDPQERTEQPPQMKLRDLRPEKDPMGAARSRSAAEPLAQ